MKEKSIYRTRIFPVIFMFLVTFVFISILSVIHIYTQKRIEFKKSLKLIKAVLYAVNINIPPEEKELEKIYKSSVEVVKDTDNKILYYKINKEGQNNINYVFITEGAGLWGRIVAVVGISSDFNNIVGIEFTKQNETPGLGARISESWFKEQFRNKNGPFSMVPEKSRSNKNEFQAITGATITSTAVEKMLNKLFKNAKTIVEQREE